MIAEPRALVRVPDLVGLPYGKARIILENAGLYVDGVVFVESYETRDTVLEQKPQRGQMIYAGEGVALSVSRESYLKWLPAIYQRSDQSGRNVIRDVLWIIQHLFESVEDKVRIVHTFFDSYEAPEQFLPWLASWVGMVLEEDWPIEKKRRLIKKAVEMYRVRGTVRGLKLFLALFTGHEPIIRENIWPFRGWRVGATSEVGIDTVVLPAINLARTFVVEMPVAYQDLSPEAVIRIHEIIQREKPAHTQYYLRFAVEAKRDELREFMVIGTRSTIGIDVSPSVTSDQPEEILLEAPVLKSAGRKESHDTQEVFLPAQKIRQPLPNVPRADLAPVEGKEVRTDEAGGFGRSARPMAAVSDDEAAAPNTRKTKMSEVEPEDRTSRSKVESTKRTQVSFADDDDEPETEITRRVDPDTVKPKGKGKKDNDGGKGK